MSGKTERAIKLLHKIARVNGKTFEAEVELSTEAVNEKKNHASPLDIFRPRKMALRTLVQGYVW